MLRATIRLALIALCLAGCSGERAARERAAANAAAPAGARVGAVGARGDAALSPATPAELARVIREGGAPVTLVNVWATWCGPCREEFPALLSAVRQAGDVRLLLVSADFPEQAEAARTFLAEHGVSGTTYLKTGADQAFIDTLNRAWTGALPATFLYDAHGQPVAYWEGQADEARFSAAIARARNLQP